MPDPILVAVDLEHMENAARAVREAGAVARSKGTSLQICYVMPFGFYSYIEPYVSEEVLADSKLRAIGDLQKLAEDPALEGVEVGSHVPRGGVYQQILLKADQLGADMIVLNAARPDQNVGTIGPTTAQVSRFAKCKVLILR